MQIRHQVSRGLERLMTRRAAAMLGEHYGLAGLGVCDSFDQLEDSLSESGVPDADVATKQLRSMHRCGCDRVMKALPVAVDAMRLQALGGYDVAMGSIFSKIGNAIKKVAKKAVSLDPGHMLVKAIAPKLAHKVDPLMVSAPKKKTADQVAAAAAKKQTKKEAKAAKKAAKAAAKAAAALAAANAQNLSPVEAGAAVLANQAGLNIQTPDGEAFAQQAVQSAGGGGGSPMAMDDPNAPASAGDDSSGLILGLPPMTAAAIGLAGVGVLWLAFGGKKR